MSSTFFWNVRGLTDNTKHNPLSSWINRRSILFGALLETHVNEASKQLILSSLGPGWSLFDNYHQSPLGKIWFIFKNPVTVRLLFADLQSITCEVKLEDGITIIYTAIYASNEEDYRKDLWFSLRDTYAAFDLPSKPWIVGGDFNEILHPDETSNLGISSTTRAMRLFGECLGDLGLFDLPFTGPKFTWTNKCPSAPVGKKLDRCLVNGAWILQFSSSYCEFSAPEFSDHSPCHIQFSSPPPAFGTRPFKFYNLLIKNPQFLEVTKAAWAAAGPRAFTLKEFGFKLKSMKRPMKSLHRDNYSDIEKRVKQAEVSLTSAQLVALNDPTSTNVQAEVWAKDLWISLRLAEESFFRQRSRVKWLGEGDMNTPFYHGMMTMRNALNAVKQLICDDGTVTQSLQEVHALALEYFEGILCTIRGALGRCLERKLTTQYKLNSTTSLMSSFMPTSLNSTTLILLPKRPGANTIREFRPIACLNTQYKLISKLISNRLKAILPSIILPNQTAFVKDRLILENILLASEVLNGYHRESTVPKMTLKVDIAKAFDSVRWDFVLSTLQAYDLPPIFIGWIRACICSPSFSLSINGVSSGYFKGKTGLRQGDPLSPILFVMMMNILSLMLNKAAASGSFGYHQDCEDQELTHLCFADDLLIFIDGSESSLEGVFSVLSDFELMSGLAVNVSKTTLFTSGMMEAESQRIANRFGLARSNLPVRYLGTPLCTKKLSFSDCDPLLLQIKKKMSSWTTRSLSMAGRLTMLTSVISGIIGYWSSAFLLPKRVIKAINSLCSSFLWHGTIGISTGAKVAWKDICTPKKEGGLGIRNIVTWSDTCALKLIWMLFFRAGSIWVAWIRQRYLSTGPFWSLNEKNCSYSWMFRRLLKLRSKALEFIRISIGRGDITFFWWDPWTPFGSLYTYLGQDGPTRLGVPLFALVSEVWNGSSWSLPAARSGRQLELLSFLTTVAPAQGPDIPNWIINGNSHKSFISRLIWDSIRPHVPDKEWAPILWHKGIIPRHATTTWLFILNRNPTLDRLHSWGLEVETICILCGNANESRNHLFFDCLYATEVWKSVCARLNFTDPPLSWNLILTWLPNAAADRFAKIALLQAWQASVYIIWQERNLRIHSGLSTPASVLGRNIHRILSDKCTAMVSLGLKLGTPLLRFWKPP
ncbi:uncharacterized protein LOC108807802 [Raphanus sativus]|uniref:Uncharacterized protein LOC108807802 n=1 Tax=Raphanus sativus TaxID=3726 RepID=A0A6J0JIT7_RAPSA|nr:uncharacterized protein LOC108807802 [Raphanus sativus]